MNKWVIIALISVASLIAVPIGIGALTSSVENNHTGTANRQKGINAFYDSVNATDGQDISWTWNVGDNSKTLQVTNVGEVIVRVFLYVTDIPSGWTVSLSGAFVNGTLLDTGLSTSGTFTVNCPDTIVDGQTYSLTTVVDAQTA